VRLKPIIIAGWLLPAQGLMVHADTVRINQEGRILGAVPAVTNSILFNTTNADAVVSTLQIFPATNPWNENVSQCRC
jgi:hypothetical protein